MAKIHLLTQYTHSLWGKCTYIDIESEQNAHRTYIVREKMYILWAWVRVWLESNRVLNVFQLFFVFVSFNYRTCNSRIRVSRIFTVSLTQRILDFSLSLSLPKFYERMREIRDIKRCLSNLFFDDILCSSYVVISMNNFRKVLKHHHKIWPIFSSRLSLKTELVLYSFSLTLSLSSLNSSKKLNRTLHTIANSVHVE